MNASSRILVASLTILLLASTGCAPPPPDDTAPDAGSDADTSDVYSDTGDDVGGDDADTDATDTDAPPQPDPWDCDPQFELDDQRYSEAEPLDGADLADELHAAVADHEGQGYDDAREFLFEQLEVRDHGELECVYTDDRVEPDGTNTPGDKFNTEHTWPQSRGADVEPNRSDMHHLFAVEMDANNRRADYEFGHVACDESTCNWHRDESFLGPSADDDRDPIFQVQPERRGDIARAILYYSLRYDEPVSPEEETVLRDWNCENPPDDYELGRNDAIEQFQSNRNPFIDRPDFVDRIDEF